MSKFRLSNALELIGLYAIPFIANGISNGIIIALNINADKIAESGEVKFIMFSASICGMANKHCRNNRKIFRNIIRNTKRR